MNVQIFGRQKCFDTKKAQRFFKERGVGFQFVDLAEKGFSRRELESVIAGAGGIDNLVSADINSGEYQLFRHLTPDGKFQKLLDVPLLFKTPIVRNGKSATVGHKPEVWRTWE
ncbi:arsenate reductase [Clostridia bacterium]|nr:arsenate reductase [Clostridia bacterium]